MGFFGFYNWKFAYTGFDDKNEWPFSCKRSKLERQYGVGQELSDKRTKNGLQNMEDDKVL